MKELCEALLKIAPDLDEANKQRLIYERNNSRIRLTFPGGVSLHLIKELHTDDLVRVNWCAFGELHPKGAREKVGAINKVVTYAEKLLEALDET